MKLVALRVREVGCFADPVAVEGFSGGLDVLAGPNEMGKSTLFQALGTLFADKHTTTREEVARLQPYGGGAPTIEAEFELSGARWRLRKRFLQSRAAELRNLKTGEVWRGADVETRCEALLKDAGFGALWPGLLWAGQTEALKELAPDISQAGALQSVIEREMEAVASGDHARSVRAEIAILLKDRVTAGTGKPRKGSDWQTALQERDRLAGELAEARAKEAEALSRMERLAEIRVHLLALDGPEARTARRARSEKAAHALTEARAALQGSKAAEDALRVAERDRTIARDRLARLQRDGADAADLQRRAAEAALLLDSRRKTVAEAVQSADAYRTQRETADTRAAALQAELTASRQWEALQSALREHAAVGARLAEAEGLAAQIAGLEHRLSERRTTPGILPRMEAEARSIAILEGRLAAAAPRIVIRYEPRAKVRFTLDGKPVAEGAELRPLAPVRLVVPGVGAIEIAPAADDASAADLEVHRQQLAALLAHAGVPTIEAARKAEAEWAEAETALGHSRSRLEGLAPEGIEALKARASSLAALVAPAGVESQDNRHRAVAAIEADLARIEGERQALARRSDQAAQERMAAGTALAALEAEARSQEAQITALQERLPSAEQLAEHRTLAEAADRLAQEALLRLDAWRSRVPSAEHLARLETAAAQAEADEATATAELRRFSEESTRIEAQLDAAGQSGLGETVESLVGRHAAAQARAGRLEEEIAALQLLARTLDDVRAAARARFDKPVLARLEPYLAQVFGMATARLGSGFAPEQMVRRGREEEIGRLSKGTQEQIAVLVRLAFARLLADGGTAIPVVLDDAFAYSDDERIARVFDVLSEASQAHQVIVLTCRERVFDRLSANRLRLEPWRDLA